MQAKQFIYYIVPSMRLCPLHGCVPMQTVWFFTRTAELLMSVHLIVARSPFHPIVFQIPGSSNPYPIIGALDPCAVFSRSSVHSILVLSSHDHRCTRSLCCLLTIIHAPCFRPYPLTAPRVRPLTSVFWVKNPSITGITTTSVDAALIFAQKYPCWVRKRLR